MEFVYSRKMKRQLYSHAKYTVRVSLLLFVVRTSAVATACKKVAMITSFYDLPLSSLT